MKNTIYLDPINGNNDWSGSTPLSDTKNSDGPLRTLSGLLPRLKALRRELPCPEPITVTLAGGVYPLAETLMWNDAALSYVTVRAAAGAEVIIRGAERIEGWETCEVNGVAAWKTTLPDVKAGAWYFRSLFVEGARRPRARLPKFDVEAKDWKTFKIDAVHCPEGDPMKLDLHAGDNTFRPAPGDVQDWPSLYDAEAVILHFWVEERLPNLRFEA